MNYNSIVLKTINELNELTPFKEATKLENIMKMKE